MLKTGVLRKAILKQTALITGSTRGVGKEIAIMFKKRNFDVIITGRDANGAKKVAQELNESYDTKGTVRGFKLDFTDLEGSKKLLNKLEKREIQPSYLINNAGVLMLDSMKDVTLKKMDVMYRVNAFGPMLLSKYCMEYIWKNNHGAILFNTPPYNIDEKTTFLMPYMQTKLAQTTFMRSLANTRAGTDILVAGFWTNYPLMTDAIIARGIGTKEECMHPSILARTVDELLFNTIYYEELTQYNGEVVIDELFLKNQKINTEKYKMGENVPNLDIMFMKHLKSQ